MTSPNVVEPEGTTEAAPEAPETAAPVTETAPPASAPQPRDDKGRFAEGEAPVDAPPDTEPAPQPADATGEQALETEEGEEVSAGDYPEVEYVVGEQTLSIPGSLRGENGIFIPNEQLEPHFRAVALGHMAQRELNQLKRDHGREVAALRQEMEQERGVRAAILKELTAVMNQPDEQQAFAMFQPLRKNWEARVAKAEAGALKQRLEELQSGVSERDLDEQARNLVPELESTVAQYVTEFAGRPEFQGVNAQRIYKLALGKFFDDVFTEDAQGIHAHPEVIEELMLEEAAILARGKKAAAARVAAGQPKPTPPPTVTTKAGPAPGKAVKAPEFSSQEEVFEWMARGGHLQE